MQTIGFIGGGNMAEALIKGIITSRLVKPANIIASDIRADRLSYLKTEFAVKTEEHNSAVAARADIVVLAVKPQNMTEALESIKDAVKKDTLLISIAAGVKVAKISAVLGDMPIVRVMPNTPALVGEGASALFANEKAKSRLPEALKIFEAVGKTVAVSNESLMDAVTAVSGSGPAYFLLLTELIIKAAVELGLPEEAAKNLVFQTAKGAALLAAEADKHGETPAQLRKKVTSPGGTTEAALKVLSEGRFDEIMVKAVKRACERSKELSG
jgi:pyrroline-5-carboxylate reductase